MKNISAGNSFLQRFDVMRITDVKLRNYTVFENAALSFAPGMKIVITNRKMAQQRGLMVGAGR